MNIFKKKYELFRITEGDSAFCLTTANKFITHNNEVYEPAPLERSSIQLKFEMEKNNVTLSLGLDHAVAQRYLTTYVENEIGLTIFENYDGDTQVIWKGRLVNIGIDGSVVKLKFETGATQRKKSGAYRRYQRTCPHALYGSACRLDKADFEHVGKVQQSNKTQLDLIVSKPFKSGFFVGGMVENDAEIMRYVTASTATTALDDGSTYSLTLTLFNPFTSIDLDAEFKLYPGCDKSSTMCQDKFYNIVNFGGFPYIPNKNPFMGTII